MPTAKEKLQTAKNETAQKQIRIDELEATEKELSKQLSDITAERDGLLEYKTTTEPAYTTSKTKLSEAQEQIRLMELSRFASAYRDQEVEYREEQAKWFKYVMVASAFLTGSIMFSIFVPQHMPITSRWYQEPGFYLLDAMFLTLFVYSLKRHAHLGNLIVDYANRKTLAQSYQHLVESDEESAELESKFQERVAEIITAQPAVQDSKVTVYEHIFDQFTTKMDTLVSTIKGLTK